MPLGPTDPTMTLFNTVAAKVQEWNDAHNNGKPLFPTVTEADVRAAEKRMGFSLPPFLRLIYTEVANGGIGPGYFSGRTAGGSGLYGIKGGCSYGEEHCTLEDDVSHSGWQLDAEVEQRLVQGSQAAYTYDDENGDPDGWVTLYDTGCPSCGHYMLDLHTGHIFSIRPDFQADGFPIVATYEVDSVEALFERWVTRPCYELDLEVG